MKKLLLIVLLLIIGCGDSLPDEQQGFIDEWKDLKSRYNSENHSIRKKKIENEARTLFSINSPPREIRGWIGNVKDPGGGILKNKGIEFKVISNHKEFIPKGIPTFGVSLSDLNFEEGYEYDKNIWEEIDIGEKLKFDGKIVNELSITISGAIKQPELVVYANKLLRMKDNSIIWDLTKIKFSGLTIGDVEQQIIGVWSGYTTISLGAFVGYIYQGVKIDFKSDHTFNEFKLEAKSGADGKEWGDKTWRQYNYWKKLRSGNWSIKQKDVGETKSFSVQCNSDSDSRSHVISKTTDQSKINAISYSSDYALGKTSIMYGPSFLDKGDILNKEK
jgi:hypothetical protein